MRIIIIKRRIIISKLINQRLPLFVGWIQLRDDTVPFAKPSEVDIIAFNQQRQEEFLQQKIANQAEKDAKDRIYHQINTIAIAKFPNINPIKSFFLIGLLVK